MNRNLVQDDRSSPLAIWDGEPVERLRQHWRVPSLAVFERITSTNDVALWQADLGAVAGTTIVAEEQTRGRGRNGDWFSSVGGSLLLSMILPPSATGIGNLPEETALATAQALAEFIGEEIGFKAPNDVISRRRRKLAGVLIERARSGYTVVGIGINVAQDVSDFPEHLRSSAESLKALGVQARRSALAGVLIEHLRPLIAGHSIARAVTATKRDGSTTTSLTRVGKFTVRVDSDEHSEIWTRPASFNRTTGP